MPIIHESDAAAFTTFYKKVNNLFKKEKKKYNIFTFQLLRTDEVQVLITLNFVGVLVSFSILSECH